LKKNVSLDYNPYLRQTIIKLNDKDPKNHDKTMDIKSKSFIVNYQNKQLQDWMEYLPELLNYEMNGYDFNLNFRGRQVEFEQLQKIFKDLIEKKHVELYHLKKYQDVKEKCILAEKIYKSVESCSIDCFKEITSAFIEESETKPLFDESSRFNFYVHPIGLCDTIKEVKTSMLESLSDNSYYKEFVIETLDNLEGKNFIDIPTVLVVLIEQMINKDLEDKVYQVMKQNNLKHNQVFFYSNNQHNKNKLTSLAKELNFKQMQLIDKNSDYKILKDYLDIYPMTNYIRDCIERFKDLDKQLLDVYDEEIKETEDKKDNILKKISDVDNSINTCDDALKKLSLDTYVLGLNTFEKYKDEFIKSIKTWNKSKADITSENMMERYLGYFENDIFVKRFNDFKKNVEKSFINMQNTIKKEKLDIFNLTGLSAPEIDKPIEMASYEEFEGQLNDLLSVFRSPDKSEEREVKSSGWNITRSLHIDETKTVVDQTWILESWRQKAIEVLGPIISKICDWYEKELVDLEETLKTVYGSLIENEQGLKKVQRSDLGNGMSEGDRKYQEIIDYYNNFKKDFKKLKEEDNE